MSAVAEVYRQRVNARPLRGFEFVETSPIANSEEGLMSATVSDFVIVRLREWGVRRVYGYPGDGINGITSALRKAGNASEGGMDFVHAPHEEMAAFMASAHAKYSGKLGVCLVTSGPGAIHALNGLYDAKPDHQPVLAIVGQTARTALRGSYYQKVGLQNLFKDVAEEYVQTATDPAQMRHLIDCACRNTLAEKTVTALIIPNDLQESEAVPKPPREHARLRSSTDYTTPDIVPKKRDLERAAEVLNSGERVAMLVGQRALHATEEVTEVAEILGAGVAKALLGKAALSDYEPWVTGSMGLMGTGPSWDLMQGADTLLMVGTNMPYSDFLPKEGQARGVQIDINGKWLGFATLPRSTSSATRTRPYRHSYRSSRRRPTAPGARESRGASSGGGRSSRRGR